MTVRWPTRRIAAVATVAVALIGSAVTILAQRPDHVPHDGATDRQQEVAAKGRDVMPFDLDRTTHVFTKLSQGGQEDVTADDPADRNQIELIRGHLRKEAAAFARGDFTDPVTIHGPGMPGVAQLSAAGDRLGVSYVDLPAGAKLTFTSTDPVIVQAVHAWFDAQTSDHGAHAQP
jgi:hypothetical protein